MLRFVAVGLVAVAAGLLVAPRPVDPLLVLDDCRRNLGDRRLWTVGAGVLALVMLVTDGPPLALALIALGVSLGAVSFVRRLRRRAAAGVRQAKVVEICEVLVGELQAGLPPATSLDHATRVWADLAPVARAGRLGGDIPAALHRLASAPGAEGMHELAAAWQVSQRSGAALAHAVSQVASTARSRQATRRLVRSELASAHATAVTVACLPLVALAMGAGVGADPWHFLFRTIPGLACLAAGSGLMLFGLHWIDRIAEKALDR